MLIGITCIVVVIIGIENLLIGDSLLLLYCWLGTSLQFISGKVWTFIAIILIIIIDCIMLCRCSMWLIRRYTITLQAIIHILLLVDSIVVWVHKVLLDDIIVIIHWYHLRLLWLLNHHLLVVVGAV